MKDLHRLLATKHTKQKAVTMSLRNMHWVLFNSQILNCDWPWENFDSIFKSEVLVFIRKISNVPNHVSDF